MPATSRACASCRYQRKRCDGHCQYADLFPASRYEEFQNAQRLFGVNNIHNIVNTVDPERRKQAAESILMEGKIRRADPVHGCLGLARRLKWEIEFCQKQLEDTNRRLSFFRQVDQDSKRQIQGFSDAPVELPPLPPSFFSKGSGGSGSGGGGRSLYKQMRSNPPTITLPDSSRVNHQRLKNQSSYEEGATSVEPFDFFRASKPRDGDPTAMIMRFCKASQITTQPEEPKQTAQIDESGGGQEDR